MGEKPNFWDQNLNAKTNNNVNYGAYSSNTTGGGPGSISGGGLGSHGNNNFKGGRMSMNNNVNGSSSNYNTSRGSLRGRDTAAAEENYGKDHINSNNVNTTNAN